MSMGLLNIVFNKNIFIEKNPIPNTFTITILLGTMQHLKLFSSLSSIITSFLFQKAYFFFRKEFSLQEDMVGYGGNKKIHETIYIFSGQNYNSIGNS